MLVTAVVGGMLSMIFAIGSLIGAVVSAPKRKRFLNQTTAGLVVMLGCVFLFVHSLEQDLERAGIAAAPVKSDVKAVDPAEEDAAKRQADAACLTDLDCIWLKQEIDIALHCRIAVQSLAKWDYEWTNGMFDGRAFEPAGWHKIEEGSIMVMGNKIKMQNGFGAWKRVSYLCAYDPKKKVAIEAAILP